MYFMTPELCIESFKVDVDEDLKSNYFSVCSDHMFRVT